MIFKCHHMHLCNWKLCHWCRVCIGGTRLLWVALNFVFLSLMMPNCGLRDLNFVQMPKSVILQSSYYIPTPPTLILESFGKANESKIISYPPTAEIDIDKYHQVAWDARDIFVKEWRASKSWSGTWKSYSTSSHRPDFYLTWAKWGRFPPYWLYSW